MLIILLSGAFLVPYVLFLLACGIPMFLLETAMGQFTSQGCITCWRHFCPLFEGIGYATQVVIAYAAVSYIVIQAWAFFYLFSSFSAEVPWASCRNTWNTGRHADRYRNQLPYIYLNAEKGL
uniref:Uncharacterized protein n=1 Tax=Seriola lalandi dorsalis TaxID=1841481 RepID=A0A3B4WJU5_SERLL